MPSHRPRSLVWTALLACVLTLLLCSVSAARTTSRVSVASAGSPSISSGRTTVFYDHHGNYLCAVFRRAGWWEVKHGYDEIWIETNGRRLEAHFTHHLDGWAQRRSPGQWTWGTSLPPLTRAASSGAPETAGSSRMPAVISLGTRLALTVQPREPRHSSSGGSTVPKTAEHRT